jgi:hypothetical protein
VNRIWIVVLASACSRATTDPPAGPLLEITLDGQPLTTVAITETTPLARLVPSLPPPTWFAVEAHTTDGRFVELDSPTLTYPGAEIRITRERDRLGVGVYRPVDPQLPATVAKLAAQPIASLAPITQIAIYTRGPGEKQAFVVELDGTPYEIPAGQTSSLRSQRGQSLAVLFPDPHQRVRVIAPAGEHTLAWSELSTRDVRLKQTHQGGYVFRVWDNGTKAIELRDVTKLVVE